MELLPKATPVNASARRIASLVAISILWQQSGKQSACRSKALQKCRLFASTKNSTRVLSYGAQWRIKGSYSANEQRYINDDDTIMWSREH